MKTSYECGCGNHRIDVSSNEHVFWQKRHWHIRCAFARQQEIIRDLQDELGGLKKKTRHAHVIKQVIEKLKCPICRQELGKKYTMLGEQLYHPGCLSDLGGEG